MTEVFISATCEGERCFCGQPAVRKVGEEMAYDEPNVVRHNLTSYVCAEHYTIIMGPAGARQLGLYAERKFAVHDLVQRKDPPFVIGTVVFVFERLEGGPQQVVFYSMAHDKLQIAWASQLELYVMEGS